MNHVVAMCVLLLSYATSFRFVRLIGQTSHFNTPSLKSSYLDELNVFKAEKKVLVGLTTVRSEMIRVISPWRVDIIDCTCLH